MSDSRVTQVLAAIPESRGAQKMRDTIVGVALAAGGVLSALTSFIVTIMLVWRGATIDLWTVVFVGLPFGGGLLLAVLGAFVASRELVGAGLADIANAVRKVWRRNGNGNGGASS